MPLLLGLIFVLAGLGMLIFPPKKINSIYGYRTKSSMKNIERWNFAQRYSARLFILLGVIFPLTSIIGLLVNLDESTSVVIVFCLMFLFSGTIIFATEKKLKDFE